MSVRFNSVIFKAMGVAVLSLAVTLLTAWIATIFLGGALAGTGLLLCIVCPLAIAGPASAWQFHQQERLRAAHDALAAAKTDLERLHRDLQETCRLLDLRARHDGLTGILNREGFTSALEQALAGRAGTLFILDADNFKRINDQHGHPAGDEALCTMTGAIAACLGSEDLFGRIGGEEFAVFMPTTYGEAACQAAERMRLAVRKSETRLETGDILTLSISIGGADSRDFPDLDSLWRAVDALLYAAKSAGRDRWMLDSPAPAMDMLTADPRMVTFRA